MWEKLRMDGKKKLKCNAVPTIFPTNYECLLKSQEAKKNSYNMDHYQKQSETLTISNVQPNEALRAITNNQENTSNILQKSMVIESNIQPIDNLQFPINNNLEDTRLTKVRIENRTDTTASKLDVNQPTLESALSQIQDIKKKLTEANKIICKVEKSKKNLVKRIRKLTSQKRLRVEKSVLQSSEILRKPGICNDIFEALGEKVLQFQDDREKDCMLALDEISIVPGEQYDDSTNLLIGNANIANSRGKIIHATHALIFMLAGIFSR